MNEIFPIEFIVDHQHVWLGWMSVDEPFDSFLKINDFPVCSSTREGLLMKCNGALAEFSVMENSAFNIDDVIHRLSEGSHIICDELINIWNIFLDVESSLGVAKEDSVIFNADSMDTYGRLFSGTTAARMLGQPVKSILPLDFSKTKDVFLLGKDIVLNIAAKSIPD